jgi:L-serine dehydratase
MISVFELFKIGVGPSSSHTVGPMRAAAAFAAGLPTERVARVEARLLGSLAFTGKGHATDRAVILGLAGCKPDSLRQDEAEAVNWCTTIIFCRLRDGGASPSPRRRTSCSTMSRRRLATPTR